MADRFSVSSSFVSKRDLINIHAHVSMFHSVPILPNFVVICDPFTPAAPETKGRKF
jgi:hypothetical protein